VEAIFDTVESVMDALATCIELLGVVVLGAGISIGLVRFASLLLDPARLRSVRQVMQDYRSELGGYILLGLEILIVADVIHTVIRRTQEDVVVLVAIVAIRTTIAFFLERELAVDSE
jgi:uncharacterized membrane protein